jgi:hypothetical protein
MRENILNSLKRGKELHQELIQNYSEILPEDIIASGESTFKKEFPNKVNTFISILNMSESDDDKYAPINNVDEAINLFEDEKIQKSIDKTIANENIKGYSPLKDKKMSSEEMLEAARFGIESGKELLALQIMSGKLSNK